METAIAWALLRRTRSNPLLDVPLFNLATHPLAYMAVVSGGASFVLVEAGVVLAEAVGYRVVSRRPARQALAVSALANGATILLALLLR